MLPDFNRLKVFYYIVYKGSIVSAADELHISPSAISQHLQKLEKELKTPLFVRAHKRLVPTKAGKQLYGIVKPFVAKLNLEISGIMHGKERPSGLLKLGAPVEFGRNYLPEIFASYRAKYPDVTFLLKLGDPASLFPEISDGKLDFALMDDFLIKQQLYKNLDSYSIEPIINEEIILACSKEYYNKTVIGNCSYEELITKHFISYQQNDVILKSWFKHHFNRQSITPNIVMFVDNLQAVISGIKHHLGLGIVSPHFVWDEIQRNEIIQIKTLQQELTNKISLVQFFDKIPSLTEKMFELHLRKEISLKGGFQK